MGNMEAPCPEQWTSLILISAGMAPQEFGGRGSHIRDPAARGQGGRADHAQAHAGVAADRQGKRITGQRPDAQKKSTRT